MEEQLTLGWRTLWTAVGALCGFFALLSAGLGGYLRMFMRAEMAHARETIVAAVDARFISRELALQKIEDLRRRVEELERVLFKKP